MVTAYDVNFRSGAGLEHTAMYQWGYGHCVQILSEDGDWYEVWDWFNNRIAWVHSDYVTVVHK